MATTSEKPSYKAPPAFHEGKDYSNWKLDIELWNDFTSVEKKKRGTALFLELKEGKVKNAVRSLGKDVISAEDGLTQIITKLDSIYLEDDALRTYRAYGRFEKFVRPVDMKLQSYLSEFEKLKADLEKQNIKLPDAVLAYRLLDSANMSKDKVELALATVKSLTFKEMSVSISKIFSVQINASPTCSTNTDLIDVKLEPEECNYAVGYSDRARYRGQPQRGRSRPKYTSRFRGIRGYAHPYSRPRSRSDSDMCYTCGLKGHFARDCSFNKGNNAQYFIESEQERISGSGTDTEETHITLFVNAKEECLISGQPELSSLVYETLGCAVIDSGCTKSVVGREWLNQFEQTLCEDERGLLKFEKCCVPFRFGDGKETISKQKTKIPGWIGKTRLTIEANVVDCNLPLLLSKPSLKKAGAIIDFVKDVMVFNGQEIQLLECKAGHYCVPICKKKKVVRDIDTGKDPGKIVLTVSEETLLGKNNKEMKAKALKLHRQFSHASFENLKSLLKSGGFNKQEFLDALEDVCKECQICAQHRKPKPRPVVGLPRGKTFNDLVAMDLKTLDESSGILLLHMIDSVTRFSMGKIIRNKRKETIVSGFCSGWLSLFGTPGKVMSDNGGEFANDEYVEMCEQFNIELQNSAAESPFSNGMVERHHKMLTEMILKTKADSNCSWEVALSWALSAKNSMQMFGGYSAYQLTMGKNPTLPNIIDDELPALENPQVSKVLEENLTAMRNARENFAKVESSQKIKRALRAQVRTCNDLQVSPGEKVMYKRNNPDKWHGPGKVIGREGQCVIVKHGFNIVKVHPCHIQKCAKQEIRHEQPPQKSGTSGARVSDTAHNYLEVSDKENEVENNVSENWTEDNSATKSPRIMRGIPKPKTFVKYIAKDDEAEDPNWKRAYIQSRGGKVKGKYGSYLNVKLDEEEEPRCVDWTQLASEWTLDTGEEEEQEILLSTSDVYEHDVQNAKIMELEKFQANNVYEKVPNEGQSTIGVRWVITKKPSGEAKARLVALGYQEQSGHIRKDSPTCHKDSIRVVLTLVAAYKWELEHIDVQSAFLQGKEITRDIFIKPPPEANSTYLWKLKKCIYGLVDGPRNWYVELKDTLEEHGMKVSKLDDSFLFLKQGDSNICGVMVVHVDDLMFSGTKQFHENVVQNLKAKYRLSTEVKRNFVYTGLNIKQHGFEYVAVNQLGYIDQIKPIVIEAARNSNNSWEINEEEKSQLRSACGQLLWASTQTRPDVCYTACMAGSALTKGTIADLKLVNKTIKYMKTNHLVLRYNKVDLKKSAIVVFCDAAFGNMKDGSSQGGHIVFLTERNGNSCPLTWQSKKIRRVCKSTLAAESWAMVEALESAELIWTQLKQMEIEDLVNISLTCITDCKSLYDAIHTTNTLDDKGLRIPVACLRQRVENKEIRVRWVRTKLQLADTFTKAGASSKLLCDVLASGKLPVEFMGLIFNK